MVLSKDEFIYLIFVIAAAILLLLLFFIFMMVVNVKIRKQKEIEKLSPVIATQESERKRIAEDMHDDIGPMLSAIKLQINTFISSNTKEELEMNVKETSSHLNVVIQNIRNIVRNLSPANLHQRGLIQSIEDFRNIIEKNKSIGFNFICEGKIDDWNESAEANVYRVIHEMINNSIKHSNCSEINLVMKRYETKSVILYVDNGHLQLNGQHNGQGMGLKNIKSRVSSINGKMMTNRDFSRGAFYYIVVDNNNLTTEAKHRLHAQ